MPLRSSWSWSVHTRRPVRTRTVRHVRTLAVSRRWRTHTVRSGTHHTHGHLLLLVLVWVRVLRWHVWLTDVAPAAFVEFVGGFVLRHSRGYG